VPYSLTIRLSRIFTFAANSYFCFVSTPIYNSIGLTYNSTRQADPYLMERMKLLLSPQEGKRYLDIGCGTGNYTVALANKGIQFTGIDPSEVMLKEARAKSNKVEWVNGVVENIPFKDETFGGALAVLTTHHWQDIAKGFKELYRVLQPGSKCVIFTSLPEQMETYWLNHYFKRIMKVSGEKMLSLGTMTRFAQEAGFELHKFESYFIKPDLKDLFLQSGKHDPEIYFREEIRNGISTFAALANKEEVEKGLAQLRADIDSGKFSEIKQQYESDKGDYCFVIFKKSEVPPLFIQLAKGAWNAPVNDLDIILD
jgi:ubiquinone/menaquinone biosynthesis C-methylase UbiE